MEPDARRARRDALLEEALTLDGAAREAFLDRSCDSPSLRREIEALLNHQADHLERLLDDGAEALFGRRLSPGDRVGRYIIDARVGSGGMSDVYRAHDPVIGRQVALKVLTWSGSDEQRRRRFFAELRLLGRVVHDNVVRVYDFGEHDGMAYLVTEMLDGEDLAEAIAGGRCGDIRNRLTIARQIASALKDVHAAGILHRDIKPANVFIEKSGRAKLLDFGIARDDGAGVTMASLEGGTPGYLAPEQLQGAPASVRSDVYAFGVLLFELFSGQRLYRGPVAQVLYAVAHQPVPLELIEACPSALVDVVRQCTAKDAAQRIEDFDAVARLLNGIVVPPSGSTTEHESVRRPRPHDRFADPDETQLASGRARSSVNPDLQVATVVSPSGNRSTPSTRGTGSSSRRISMVAAVAVSVLSIAGVVVWMNMPDQARAPSIANSSAPVLVDPNAATAQVAASPSNPPVTPAPAATPPTVGDSLSTQLDRIARLNQQGNVAAALDALDRIGPSDDRRVTALARSVAQAAGRSMDAAHAAAARQKAAELAPVPYAAAEEARLIADAALNRGDYVHGGRQALVAADAYRRAESEARDAAATAAAARTAKSDAHPADAASSAAASPAPIPEASVSSSADRDSRSNGVESDRDRLVPVRRTGSGPESWMHSSDTRPHYSARSLTALRAVYPNLPQETRQRLDGQFRGCGAYDVTFGNNTPSPSNKTIRRWPLSRLKRRTYAAAATNPVPDQRTVPDVFSLRKTDGEWLIERMEDAARR